MTAIRFLAMVVLGLLALPFLVLGLAWNLAKSVVMGGWAQGQRLGYRFALWTLGE